MFLFCTFSPGFALQGIAFDKEERILAMGAGSSFRSFESNHQFGLFVLDISKRGGGWEKFLGYFPTQGPCFFNLSVHPQGKLIAIVETPFLNEKMEIIGKYQLIVIAVKD